MKHVLYAIVAVILLVGFQACWDVDEGENVVLYDAMVFVKDNQPNTVFETDLGDSLRSNNALWTGATAPYKAGDRLFIRFSIDDTTQSRSNFYPVTVYSYTKVEMESYFTLWPDSASPFESSPFYSTSIVHVTGDFLNVIAQTYQVYGDSNSVNLIYHKAFDSMDANGNPSLSLELVHNAAGVYTGYYFSRFYSYDLSRLRLEFPEADTIKFELKWIESATGNNRANFVYVP